MKILIAADIHGVTDALRAMLTPVAEQALFLSPWPSELCPYTEEQEAVAAFLGQNGMVSYTEKIAAAAEGQPAFLIGFSVGASAAWLYSASEHCHPSSVASLFYGSRIRDYADLQPRCAVTAIFAEREPSFSPPRLVTSISHGVVRAAIEEGTSHGFMNPLSANFAPRQCSVHVQKLAADLARFRADQAGERA